MQKELPEMTLEELWELFPIFLVAHDDRWKDRFNEIGETLTGLLSGFQLHRLYCREHGLMTILEEE